MGTKTEKVIWLADKTMTLTQCSGTSSSDYSYAVFTGTNVITKGANYPDWKYRLANGIQCTTVMSGTKYSRPQAGYAFFRGKQKPPPPFDDCRFYPYLSTINGHLNGFHLSESQIGVDQPDSKISMVTADNQAKTAFVKRAREVQTSFQGGVFLGELGESLRMLVSPAKSLRKGISAYLGTLKKRRRQVRRVPPRRRKTAARKILADTWLEYAYGWRPLLSDIDEAAKLLASRHLASNEKWKPISAFGIDQVYQPRLFDAYGSSFVNQSKVAFESYSKKQVTYRGQVSIVNPVNRPWDHAGFTLNDFVPTVWELIPYSFLVDYFTNIGDVISAATFFRSNLRWVARTEFTYHSTKAVSTMWVATPSGSFSREVSGMPVREHRTKTIFSRAPYTGSLVPSLEFSIPGWGTKWINMGALLVSSRAMTPFHR